ncbi:MAG: dihydrofolate reductase family protein [Pyrinomonadaceae bacterium]
MRKVKLFIADSLDGFIARPDGSVDWLFMDADYGMTAFHKSIDTILFGRKTYDVALGLGGAPSYKGIKNCVFSRTLKNSADKNFEFVSGDIRSFIESLKQSKGKDIWLMGGGELIESFMNERLIDEFILTVHPIILGEGLPLFRGSHRQTDLKLLDCKTYDSGIVQVSYSLK